MTHEEKLMTISGQAGADLSAKQYHFVSIAADSQYDATGDGAESEGVLQNDPAAAGRAATIGIAGVSMVIAGEALAAGAVVSSNAAGRAKVPATGNVELGKTLEAATADGERIAVLLYGPGGNLA